MELLDNSLNRQAAGVIGALGKFPHENCSTGRWQGGWLGWCKEDHKNSNARTGGQDGVEDVGAKVAEVGDGEGSRLEFVWRQLLGARALDQVGPVAGDLVDVGCVRIFDHRCDEAAVGHRHRQRHIDALVVCHPVAVRRTRCEQCSQHTVVDVTFLKAFTHDAPSLAIVDNLNS